MQEAKDMASLCKSSVSPEPSLLNNAISSEISCANQLLCSNVHIFNYLRLKEQIAHHTNQKVLSEEIQL